VTLADVLLTTALYAVFLPYAYHDYRSDFWTLAALGAANMAALLAKKRFPLPTLVAILVLAGLISWITRHPYPVTGTTLISLYAVGRYTSRWTAISTALVTTVIGFVVSFVVQRIPAYGWHNISELGWVLFACVAGAWVRTQRAGVIAAEDRAVRAEHEREEMARRRVAEERLRIARELHDVVGHAIMSISVQSSAGARVAEQNPAAGKQSLETIADISGSALREIRVSLGMLREDAEAPTHPERGMGDLPELIEQAVTNGIPVTLMGATGEHPIPAVVGFTVYRIVQESLTNIAKHGREVTNVRVTVARSPENLHVTVADDGIGTAEPREVGMGIQGMRERVAALGGSLEITVLSGFRVHARLPVSEAQ
jgi:signal transduction histidine kinase